MSNLPKYLPLSNFEKVFDLRYLLFTSCAVLFGDASYSIFLKSSLLSWKFELPNEINVGTLLIWLVAFGIFMLLCKHLRKLIQPVFNETVLAVRLEIIDWQSKLNIKRKDKKEDDVTKVLNESNYVHYSILKSYSVLRNNNPAYWMSLETEKKKENEEMIRDYYFSISILILVSLLITGSSILTIIESFPLAVLIEYLLAFISLLMLTMSLRYPEYSISYAWIANSGITKEMNQLTKEKYQK
jgi:hypothetical protein